MLACVLLLALSLLVSQVFTEYDGPCFALPVSPTVVDFSVATLSSTAIPSLTLNAPTGLPADTSKYQKDEANRIVKRQAEREGGLPGCGNEQLRQIMQHVLGPLLSRNHSRIGDVAQILQQAVQTATGRSHEVLMGKSDMVVASHQQNATSHCRLRIGAYYTTVYETHIQYDIRDVAQERFMSNIDFGQKLGGTGYFGQKPFPHWASRDAREHPLGSAKLPIEPAQNYTSLGAGHARLGGCGNAQLNQVMQRELNSLRNQMRNQSRIGDIANVPVIFNPITLTYNDFARSDQSEQRVQQSAQSATGRSVEVLIGKSKLIISSYQMNETSYCRMKMGDYYAVVYDTPVQYNIADVAEEQFLSTIDFGEKLGGSGAPGQKPFPHWATRGPRQQPEETSEQLTERVQELSVPDLNPKESDEVRTLHGNQPPKAGKPEKAGKEAPKKPVGHARLRGSGNMQLGQISQRVLKPLLARKEMKLGDIAKALQKSVQTATGKSHEILMGKGDMMIASHLMSATSFSRMRFGDYYTLIYETPVQYNIANVAEEEFLSNVDFGESLGGSGSPGQAPLQHLGHARLQGDGSLQLRAIMKRDLSQLLPKNQVTMKIGDIAKVLQQSLHSATGNSHEVFIGKGDMMIASHQMSLSNFARARFGDYYTLVYRTPVQYDIANAAEEQFFSNIDSGQVATQQLTFNNFPQNIGSEFVEFVAEAPFPVQAAPPVDFASAAIYGGLNGLNGLDGQGQGAGGGGGGACFSGDLIVETIDGPKRMRDLKTGDQVLSVDQNMISFSPIVMFLHRDEQLVAEFNVITTASGESVKLTNEHIIYVSDCNPNSPLRLARGNEVTTMHCLNVLRSPRRVLRDVRVIDVTKTYERGIYSPLTLTGDIIVNNVLSSCHSKVAVRTLQQGLFTAYRFLSFFLPEEGPLPLGLDYIISALDLFIPVKHVLFSM